jgi:hydrogenase nickel incorporation protein HypA/HybF
MHELSIAVALVEQAEAICRRENGTRVLSIAAAVGALSGVDAAALEGAFPLAAAGSLAEDARLVVTPVAARGRCRDCARETDVTLPFFDCACGSANVDIVAGRELLLNSVEIAT